MTNENDCLEWLDEVGQCDLTEGHAPETPHSCVNPVDGAVGEWTKTIWPFGEDDVDVQHYLAVAQAYEDEDNRQLAEQAAARAGNADGAE